MECWGAQGGGTSSYPGGKGAYTSGNINLTAATSLYIYVGQAGDDVTNKTATNNTNITFPGNSSISWAGRYPGVITYNNGFQTYVINASWVCAGGGATDIRTVSGVWNNASSLNSRIMVAAGGAGTMFYNKTDLGGAAGAYTGYAGVITGPDGAAAKGGEQTRGGAHGTGSWSASTTTYGLTTNGRAAFGQTAVYKVCGSGGGGGWWCGGNGAHGGGTTGSGAGGSSYISGHTGCANNASYSFNTTVMIDGKGYKWTNTSSYVSQAIPAHSGYSSGAGHTGNGYARIKLNRW